MTGLPPEPPPWAPEPPPWPPKPKRPASPDTTPIPAAPVPPPPAVATGTPPPPDRPVLRPLTIGQLLDTAIRVYRSRWTTFIAVAASVLVPLNFLQYFLFRDLYDAFATGRVPVTIDQAQRVQVVTLVSAAITTFVVIPFMTAAMAKATAATYLGERTTVGATFRFALSRLGAVLWVTLLFVLMIAGLFVPLIAVALTGADAAGLVALVVLPAAVFLFIAGVRFYFAPTVVVVEDGRGTRAMRRSWQLTKGRFWRTLGAIVLAGLLATVVSAVITIPATLLSRSATSGGWMIDAAGASLAQVIVQPFSTIVAVLLYFDLRVRKEGFDLALLARALSRSG